MKHSTALAAAAAVVGFLGFATPAQAVAPAADPMVCLFKVPANEGHLSKKVTSRIAKCAASKPSGPISITIREESNRSDRATQAAVTREFVRRGCVESTRPTPGKCRVVADSQPTALYLGQDPTGVLVFAEVS